MKSFWINVGMTLVFTLFLIVSVNRLNATILVPAITHNCEVGGDPQAGCKCEKDANGNVGKCKDPQIGEWTCVCQVVTIDGLKSCFCGCVKQAGGKKCSLR